MTLSSSLQVNLAWEMAMAKPTGRRLKYLRLVKRAQSRLAIPTSTTSTPNGSARKESFLFNDTIYKNVAYGLCRTEWQDSPDSEKFKMAKSACREAYANEFISQPPKGYDIIVGESDIKLNDGQRQRLAIACTIVKQPSILILDEATNAIDVRTELVVQAALYRVAQNWMSIAIAHRLSTIKKADNIVVLRQGKAVEEGTYEQLLQDQDCVYHGLVNAQALVMGQD